MACCLVIGHSDQVAEQVVVLRPVNETDVAVESAWLKQRVVNDPPVRPEVQRTIYGLAAVRIKAEPFGFAGSRMGVGKVEQPARPGQGGFIFGT